MFARAVAAIGRGVGCCNRAPQVVAGRERTGAQRAVAEARSRKLLVRRLCLCGGVVALHQSGGFQCGALLGPRRSCLRLQRRLRQIINRKQCAGHQQGGLGDEVVERRCAHDRHIGFAGHHGVEPIPFNFRSTQHRTAAVGYAHAERARVGRGEWRRLRIGTVERLQAELQRLQQMPAPVRFRVVARMRVLERDAVRGVCSLRSKGQRAVAGGRAVSLHAAAGVQIEVIAAGALVGIGDGATMGQAPAAGSGNRAIDATGAGGGRSHQAAARRIEVVGYLHQHAMRLACAGKAAVGGELASR
ncbi:hypothetical protein D3C71_1183820 [compost metagenome]